MKSPISDDQWNTLRTSGFLRVRSAFSGPEFHDLDATVNELLSRYPHGFVNPPLYSGRRPEPRPKAPVPTDRAPTVIIPHVGFMAPELMRPLANPFLYDLLTRVVGKQFYLSNTWFQAVPPGTGRLAYHKDPRGSITFNILLDDIEPKMGSTCLVPGSHINTPPAAYGIRNIQAPHPREVDMIGNAGDLVLFSPETWHARSENFSDRWTRRLFYNFYSRSSRESTAWHGLVDQDQIDKAKAKLPPQYHHMFEIDPATTRQLARIDGSALRKWALGASSSNHILRDFVYARQIYGHSAESDNAGFLLPFTTRLVEAKPFSALEYAAHVKPLPAAKNFVTYIRRTAREVVGRRAAKSGAPAFGE